MQKLPCSGVPAILNYVPRLGLFVFALLTVGCNSQRPLEAPRSSTVKPAWYDETLIEVQALNRDALQSWKSGKGDQAAATIQQAQPLIAKLQAVNEPTLAVVEAASDLDDLYGRMLLANRHWGWARLMFQKNLARWKHWSPKTEDTARRFKEAQDAINECDKHILE